MAGRILHRFFKRISLLLIISFLSEIISASLFAADNPNPGSETVNIRISELSRQLNSSPESTPARADVLLPDAFTLNYFLFSKQNYYKAVVRFFNELRNDQHLLWRENYNQLVQSNPLLLKSAEEGLRFKSAYEEHFNTLYPNKTLSRNLAEDPQETLQKLLKEFEEPAIKQGERPWPLYRIQSGALEYTQGKTGAPQGSNLDHMKRVDANALRHYGRAERYLEDEREPFVKTEQNKEQDQIKAWTEFALNAIGQMQLQNIQMTFKRLAREMEGSHKAYRPTDGHHLGSRHINVFFPIDLLQMGISPVESHSSDGHDYLFSDSSNFSLKVKDTLSAFGPMQTRFHTTSEVIAVLTPVSENQKYLLQAFPDIRLYDEKLFLSSGTFEKLMISLAQKIERQRKSESSRILRAIALNAIAENEHLQHLKGIVKSAGQQKTYKDVQQIIENNFSGKNFVRIYQPGREPLFKKLDQNLKGDLVEGLEWRGFEAANESLPSGNWIMRESQSTANKLFINSDGSFTEIYPTAIMRERARQIIKKFVRNFTAGAVLLAIGAVIITVGAIILNAVNNSFDETFSRVSFFLHDLEKSIKRSAQELGFSHDARNNRFINHDGSPIGKPDELYSLEFQNGAQPSQFITALKKNISEIDESVEVKMKAYLGSSQPSVIVQTEKPYLVKSDGWIPIVTPEGYKLSHFVLWKEGRTREQNKYFYPYDVKVFQDKYKDLYWAKLKDSGVYQVRATFEEVSTPNASEAFNVPTKTVARLADQLYEVGFSKIATDLKTHLETLTTKDVRAGDIVSIFERNAKYETDGINHLPSILHVRNPFFELTKFQTKEGCLLYQCTGADLAMRSFFGEAFKNRPEIEVKSISSYSLGADEKTLSENSGHRRTRLFNNLTREKLILDATPSSKERSESSWQNPKVIKREEAEEARNAEKNRPKKPLPPIDAVLARRLEEEFELPNEENENNGEKIKEDVLEIKPPVTPPKPKEIATIKKIRPPEPSPELRYHLWRLERLETLKQAVYKNPIFKRFLEQKGAKLSSLQLPTSKALTTARILEDYAKGELSLDASTRELSMLLANSKYLEAETTEQMSEVLKLSVDDWFLTMSSMKKMIADDPQSKLKGFDQESLLEPIRNLFRFMQSTDWRPFRPQDTDIEFCQKGLAKIAASRAQAMKTEFLSPKPRATKTER